MALTQNEDMGNGQMVETKIDVYMDLVQTAGVSFEVPQGEWTDALFTRCRSRYTHGSWVHCRQREAQWNLLHRCER